MPRSSDPTGRPALSLFDEFSLRRRDRAALERALARDPALTDELDAIRTVLPEGVADELMRCFLDRLHAHPEDSPAVQLAAANHQVARNSARRLRGAVVDVDPDAALIECYERLHGEGLRWLASQGASREDAEEILQDVFQRICRRLADGGLPDTLDGYAIESVKRAWVDHGRRAAAHGGARLVAVAPSRGDGVAEPGSASGDGDPARVVEHRQDLRFALAALYALPARRRKVVQLVRLEGLTIAEAASRLGLARRRVEKDDAKASRDLARYHTLFHDICRNGREAALVGRWLLHPSRPEDPAEAADCCDPSIRIQSLAVTRGAGAVALAAVGPPSSKSVNQTEPVGAAAGRLCTVYLIHAPRGRSGSQSFR